VQASEDIAQEAFIKAWQQLNQLSNPSSFLPWLRQITRNLARDWLRANRGRPLSGEAAEIAISMAADPGPTVGFAGAYRTLWREVRSEWRRDRNVIYYLLASAVFRDGLTGIFAFGAVLGVSVYGVSQADVLIFGVCVSVVAAVGAAAGGLLADRAGPKPVITCSLAAMLAVALVLLNGSGTLVFWVCGLALCLFVGPILASARALMLRLAAPGKAGVAFGLYTTTGRAASFLAPWMFFTFVDLFGTDRAGLGGLCVVLAAGLLAMLAVRVPREAS